MSGKNSVGKFGTLLLKVVETRDFKSSYCSVSGVTARAGVVKKNEKNAKYDESFTLPLNQDQSVLSILFWEKAFIGHDKARATISIPVSAIDHAPFGTTDLPAAQWYPLIKPDMKAINSGVQISAAKPPEAVSDDKLVTPAADSGIVGYARLQMLVADPEKEKAPEPVGIILDGKWDENTNAGNINRNPNWYENPQFLLTVGTATEVTIGLVQDEAKNNPATFYVIRYNDDLFDGRRLTYYVNEDLVTIGTSDIPCPNFGVNIRQEYSLSEGTYCVVPCFSEKSSADKDERYTGDFKIFANANPIKAIAFTPLPKEDSGNWTVLSCPGEWSDDGPQFLLTTKSKHDCSIVVTQATNDTSIGVSVIPVDDTEHRLVFFKKPIVQSKKMLFTCCLGCYSRRLPAGSYCILPNASEPKGKFKVIVYTEDKKAKLTSFDKSWANRVSVKGIWSGKSAGGAISNESFANNPQFTLKLKRTSDKCDRKFILLLSQRSSRASTKDLVGIGIVVVKSRKDGQRVTMDDVHDGIVFKPEGWADDKIVMLECKLPDDCEEETYVVIPSTFNPGDIHKFNMAVFTDMEASFTGMEEEEEEDDDDEEEEEEDDDDEDDHHHHHHHHHRHHHKDEEEEEDDDDDDDGEEKEEEEEDKEEEKEEEKDDDEGEEEEEEEEEEEKHHHHHHHHHHKKDDDSE